MPANGLITLPTGIDLDDIEAVEAAIKYIPQSALPGPFCDIGFDRTVYPVGAGFDLASLDLAAQVQALFTVPGTLGAYFSADPQYIFEDSAATTPASIGSPVGAWTSATGAYQATTANKPILRQTPETGIYWLDSNTVTSALTATFAESLGSNCTIVRAGPDGVTFEEGQTIGTTYNIAPRGEFNTEVMLINRALTAAEKALLTRYMGRRVPTVGPNLLVNGDFSNGSTGWTLASDAVIDGEKIKNTTGDLTYSWQQVAIEPSAQYIAGFESDASVFWGIWAQGPTFGLISNGANKSSPQLMFSAVIKSNGEPVSSASLSMGGNNNAYIDNCYLKKVS